ncbi:DUF3794 domain-containing protein [Bacillus sp. HMF5848]|uniref:CsxC family protein n=1 Tax=Bacillus sp. HMF5848 TaxID=2495421 RepID=UPI000F7764EA|nr:DUF3794 domain-containing protein [Bacillus sp. HMF5848]RSK27756.1 DUF3794 domain-containing protein [Bacillus sp. HMF5848]
MSKKHNEPIDHSFVPEGKAELHHLESHSHKHHPRVCLGKVITKVPVILAELDLQINMDATITFPEPVLEIKDIKKRVKLTQCRLLLPTNKLFIKGFVRKNIQYASPCHDIQPSDSTSIASDLHSYTVDIPFQLITEIKDYITHPVMPIINEREEFDFFISKKLPTGFPEKDELLTSDLSQFHQQSKQFYNELPFCEMISSNIIEWDEAIDRMPLPNHSPIHEGYFTKIEEKMVLDITVRILQNQQIRVTSITNDDNDDCCYDNDLI